MQQQKCRSTLLITLLCGLICDIHQAMSETTVFFWFFSPNLPMARP
jgi:hypothetical protein